MSLPPYLTPVGLLVVPVLAANLVFAGCLPPAYQPGVFQADIPGAIALPEMTLRVAMFALMFFLPLRHTRLGWAVYLAGVAIYAAAWTLQALAPDSALATTAIGFTAPAWTAGLWLAGIGILAQPPDFSRARLWIIAYWSLAAAFLAAHVAHAGLVWARF